MRGMVLAEEGRVKGEDVVTDDWLIAADYKKAH